MAQPVAVKPFLSDSHVSQPEKTLSNDGSAEIPWSPDAERKLVRKIDLSLLPMLWAMNLLSWMDRANLGNANIAGLTSDLRLTSSQFSMAVITYYFGSVAWAPISSLIVSRTRPSLYLPTIMLLWGVVTAASSAVQTYPQLLVMRLFMGILECGLTPGMAFIFSSWYTPHELGKRASLFLTSAQVGGLFGGLIAGGIMAHLEGARGIRGWRWLFIVEGAVTVAVSLMAYYILEDYPASCRHLSKDEKHIATTRLQHARANAGGSEARPTLGLLPTIYGALKSWKLYIISIGTVLYGAAVVLTYFYPVLVKGLGYKDPVMAQYMTAPIWGVAVVCNLASGFLADRIPQYRALIVTAGVTLISLMSILVCVIYDFKARYVLLSFMTGGLWVAYSQLLAYLGELFADEHPDVRSFCIGIVTVAAQICYFYGAYLFPTENAPKHLLGFGAIAGTSGGSAIIYSFLWWAVRYTERRRSAHEHVG